MAVVAPRKVVLATRNAHKLEELQRMLEGIAVDLVSLDQAAPHFSQELEENGDTFEENALAKARQAVALTGLPALADDSGLEVDALDGAPGVFSARFAGRHGDTKANMALLLEKLEAVPDPARTARFRCVMALVEPVGHSGLPPTDARREVTFHGTCEGLIARSPRGTGGFGYDPVFWVPDLGRTVAELDPDAKDQISHRGVAVRQLREYLLATFFAS